jgi:hypothetical protein
MTQGPMRQEVFALRGGVAMITFPTNMSPEAVLDLKNHLDSLIIALQRPTNPNTEWRSTLRGLAELAAYEAGILTAPGEISASKPGQAGNDV